MTVKVISDFIDSSTFECFKLIMMENPYFPWYFANYVNEPNEGFDGFMFCHTFYNNDGIISGAFDQIMLPILDKLGIGKNELIRAKSNLYTKQDNHIEHGFHVDDGIKSYGERFKVALLNINTNNGYTEFETGEKVISRENEVILFDGSIRHRSVTQTDNNRRVNININYLINNSKD